MMENNTHVKLYNLNTRHKKPKTNKTKNTGLKFEKHSCIKLLHYS